jgi:outer membrane protein OmpA-like peptidoglycan-associated protein
MKLSENRAASVKQWLVANAGIRASRIRIVGWGETKPVAPNTNPDGSDNPKGRQKNRRVELTLQTG